MTAILRVLGIQAGEARLAAGLFSYSLSIGVGRVFVLTASQALFLEFYPASDLAWVYMIAAAATIVSSAAYLRLGRALSARDLILGNLAFTLLVTLVLRLLLGATDSGWPAMALAAWFHVVFALSSFAFWGAATQVVDIRQGKRLFPIVTTGDVVAFSLGGFFILGVVDRLGTANLLWIGALGFGLAIAALLYTLAHSDRPVDASASGDGGDDAPPVPWRGRYLRLMMAYFVLSAAVFILLDNAFNDVAQRRFEGAAELARFFATYSAIAAIVNFVFRSLFAGRLVRRFGLVLGLAILPAVVGLGSGAVALSGTLLPGLGLVFWLTVATRLSDKVLRGVQYASMATLYQPLGPRGSAVQAAMDGIIDSAAIGLTGALLLGLHAVFDIGAVELAGLLVVGCGLWLAVAVGLHREFVTTLGQALHRRRLLGDALDVGDESLLALIREQIRGGEAEEVVYGLGLLARADDPALPELLPPLLDHASEDVVLEALRHLAERGAARPPPRVAELAVDPGLSPRLRGRAILALAALSEEVPEAVLEALEDEEREVRRGAMVGLLRSGSIEGIVYAGAALLDDLRSERPEARAEGAEVLRDAGLPSFRRQALPLLRDSDLGVRRRAVEAAAAMGHPDLWPHVVAALEDPALAQVASDALLHAGTPMIPFLRRAFQRDGADPRVRIAAVRIVGLMRGPAVAEALFPLVGDEDGEVRTAVLAGLVRSGARPDGHRDALSRQLEAELGLAAHGFAALADLAALEGPEVREVAEALEEEIRAARHRVFLILALLRPEADLVTSWENYAAGTRDRRAYALELLDSHLDARERARIFPLLDEQALAERAAALVRAGAAGTLEPDERLRALASASELSPWTRLCARRAALERGLDVAALTDAEARLYERTVRLRRVEMFGELPGAVLAGVVPRLQSLELPEGYRVIRKGEEGDSMYVVLAGSVLVHDGDAELATFGADQVFGEFTVLQRAGRTASVTTREPTRLLRLTREDLHELIREDVSVARALIRVIVRRLRRTQRGSRPAAGEGPRSAPG